MSNSAAALREAVEFEKKALEKYNLDNPLNYTFFKTFLVYHEG